LEVKVLSINAKKKRDMQKILSYMMHIAFVEIRSCNSLNAAKKFSDIFHKLPMMLLNSESDEEDLAIYEKLIDRSKRYDLQDYIKKLKVIAEKNQTDDSM